MFNKTLASDPAVRECLRSGLDILKTALALAATRITTKGLTEGATEDLIESAAQTMADCLPAVDPVGSQQEFAPEYHDDNANSLLNGARPEDGGGSGIALATTADGACMFNAACTATYGSMCLKPSDTDCLALPLRHAVVRRGISNMTKHIENRRSFLRTTYAYDTKVGDAALSRGLDYETEEGSDDTYTPDVARAFLVLALQDITGPYSEGSAFCLPLLAEVTGLSFRWYHPGASIETAGGSKDAVGGRWNKIVFPPVVGEGSAQIPRSHTVCLAMSYWSPSSSPNISFSTLGDFREKVCMVPRLHQETNEQIGEDFRMIPLTHVVPIVPVPGGVHQPLVQPQVQVQGPAEGMQGDSISQSWTEKTRDTLYLSGLESERREATTTFAHGEKYDPRSQSFLGDEYDLGTATTALPDTLTTNGVVNKDIDYCKYRFLVSDFGSKILHHLDTLAYRRADLRKTEYPANHHPLFLTRGPGVTYVLVYTSPTDVESGQTTVLREVEKARDAVLKGLRREVPAIAAQKSSQPDLICKAHQTVSGVALQRVLSRLGYVVFFHVMWGMKVPVSDLRELDKAATRAKEAQPPGDDVTLSNVFDVATTRRTRNIPVVRAYPIGRSDFGDTLAQPNASSMRTYGQAPGIFYRPHGSIQTRGSGTPWANVVKYTMYNIVDHVLRAGGPFGWKQPRNVIRAKRNLEHLRKLLDFFSTPEGTELLKQQGQGLRMEVRIRAVTAEAAAETVDDLGILNPETAFVGLGQYQTRETTDPVTKKATTVTYLPINFLSAEVWLANGMRLVQSAHPMFKGRSSNRTTRLMMKVGADVLAGLGRTDSAKRASSGHDLVPFWLHEQETEQSLANAARAEGLRRNPSRAARRSPVVELSNNAIVALENGETLPAEAGVEESHITRVGSIVALANGEGHPAGDDDDAGYIPGVNTISAVTTCEVLPLDVVTDSVRTLGVAGETGSVNPQRRSAGSPRRLPKGSHQLRVNGRFGARRIAPVFHTQSLPSSSSISDVNPIAMLARGGALPTETDVNAGHVPDVNTIAALANSEALPVEAGDNSSQFPGYHPTAARANVGALPAEADIDEGPIPGVAGDTAVANPPRPSAGQSRGGCIGRSTQPRFQVTSCARQITPTPQTESVALSRSTSEVIGAHEENHEEEWRTPEVGNVDGEIQQEQDIGWAQAQEKRDDKVSCNERDHANGADCVQGMGRWRVADTSGVRVNGSESSGMFDNDAGGEMDDKADDKNGTSDCLEDRGFFPYPEHDTSVQDIGVWSVPESLDRSEEGSETNTEIDGGDGSDFGRNVNHQNIEAAALLSVNAVAEGVSREFYSVSAICDAKAMITTGPDPYSTVCKGADTFGVREGGSVVGGVSAQSNSIPLSSDTGGDEVKAKSQTNGEGADVNADKETDRRDCVATSTHSVCDGGGSKGIENSEGRHVVSRNNDSIAEDTSDLEVGRDGGAPLSNTVPSSSSVGGTGGGRVFGLAGWNRKRPLPSVPGGFVSGGVPGRDSPTNTTILVGGQNTPSTHQRRKLAAADESRDITGGGDCPSSDTNSCGTLGSYSEVDGSGAVSEIPQDVLAEMVRCMKLRRGRGGHGGHTWTPVRTKPSGITARTRIFEDAANVYGEVWAMYGRRWKTMVCLKRDGGVSRSSLGCGSDRGSEVDNHLGKTVGRGRCGGRGYIGGRGNRRNRVGGRFVKLAVNPITAHGVESVQALDQVASTPVVDLRWEGYALEQTGRRANTTSWFFVPLLLEAFGLQPPDKYMAPRPVRWRQAVTLFQHEFRKLRRSDYVNDEGSYIVPSKQKLLLSKHPEGAHLQNWLEALTRTRNANVPLPIPPYTD